MPAIVTRRRMLASAGAALLAATAAPTAAQQTFRRIPTQFIAALAGAEENAGTGAENWGLWRSDPGPIGVHLSEYEAMRKAGGRGPTGWVFDEDDWWLDENGLLMHPPEFPMPAAQFFVTDGESGVGLLTVEPPDANGRQAWALSEGITIGTVTHGPCRSGRYRPKGASGSCSPANAPLSIFPLELGAEPPEVQGCDRLEYAVLIVFGVPGKLYG